MFELYFDKRGEVAMEDCRDLFRKFPQWTPRAIKSAFSSEGNRLKGIVRLAIQRGGLHGEWPKQNPHTAFMRKRNTRSKNRWLKNYYGRKKNKQWLGAWVGTPTHNAMLKMAGAVRYKYHPDLQLVKVDFGDKPWLDEYMRHQAGGYRMPVTPRMRRLAFAMGMPLAKEKTEIVIPPRPVMRPVFTAEEANIYRNVKVKIYRSIARYVTGTEKKDWPE